LFLVFKVKHYLDAILLLEPIPVKWFRHA